MHDISLITTIAGGFTFALFFGLLAKRIGLSPIIGYLIAGIVVGPHTPGFVGDIKLASQLAEIGVILLMFGVGLHFHLKDLLAVRNIALPGALGQSLTAAVACAGIAAAAGWSFSEGLVLGVATAVASTVVLLRLLIDHQSLDTTAGHVAVGWLIVEDIITVLVLVVLPTLGQAGESQSVWAAAGAAVGKLLVLGVVVAVGGTRFVPWLLLRVTRLRSSELFTLAVLVMSIAVATAAYLAFGASMALGAFLAGMLVGQSKFSHQAGAEILPLRDAFAVLFFVSVGMLFDYRVVWEEPALALGVLAVVLVAKPLVAFIIVIALRHTLRTAMIVAGGLAQIGEFSFILAEVAKGLDMLPGAGYAVVVAAAIVSIAVNPFYFRLLLKLEPYLERKAPWIVTRSAAHGAEINADMPPATDADDRAVVVGYGPVGQAVTELLAEANVDPMIVEMNVDTVAELRNRGERALYGDATRRDILKEAGIAKARYLVITLPEHETQVGIIHAARELNPDIVIITRARYLRERDALREVGANVVCADETGSAAHLAQALLHHLEAPQAQLDRELLRLRDDSREQQGAR